VVVSAIIGQARKQVKRKGMRTAPVRGHWPDTKRTHKRTLRTRKLPLAERMPMAYILQLVFLTRR
jgi:hypothetical protein